MTADDLRERAMEWARRIGVQPKEIRVESLPRKWGQCSADRIITLSSDLLACDLGWASYVALHEILHLRVRNHGRLFRAFMTVYLPGWEKVMGVGMGPKID